MDNLLFYIPKAGHVLIGLYFTLFGFWNIYHWRPTIEVMLRRAIPLPFLLLSFGIGWQIIIGVMIMFDIYVKVAALLLIPFVFVSIYLFCDFWNFKGEIRRHHLDKFVANLTITLGALLMLLANITPMTHITDLFY